MGKFIGLWLVVCLIIGLLVSCFSGNSFSPKKSPSKYNGYSDTYNSSSSYRQSMSEISDIYGISEREADAKMSAVFGYN
ncbi:MAG: hypothetical protein E7391_02810 [Ruminococcaceae bacterium]|nr:hypothetical protein [Oscillospiraceae bacterium]